MFRLFRLDPPNGWRHVWWELGIVTAGVLLALVAQQLAEAANWRARAIDGKARLTTELEEHYASLYEQASVAVCLDRQLDTLAAKVLAGTPVTVFTDDLQGDFVFRAPMRGYSDSVWQALGAQGVTSHFDKAYAARLSLYYDQLDSLRAQVNDFLIVDRDLAFLVRGLELPPTVRIDMVRQIEALRRTLTIMAIDSNQLLRVLTELGIHPSDARRRELLPNSRTTDFCRAQGLPVTAPKLGISLT